MAVRIYWVVYADGAGKPSDLQIRSGQNAGGAAALASGDALYTAGGTLTFPPVITALAPNTPYQEAFVAYDDIALTYSNSVESATITTEAITPISVSVNESFTLTTVENASSTKLGSVNESVTVTDSQNTTATYRKQTNESVTVTDSQNAIITTGPVTYPVSVNESVTVTDSQNASVSGSVVNPPWENVVTLLHNDGLAQPFVDSSQYNWPITNTSGIKGEPAKFGTAAQSFPGYFSINGLAPELAFGTGDFTLEAQFYRSPGQVGKYLGWNGAGGEFSLGVDSFGDLLFNLPGGGSGSAGGLVASGYTWIVVTRASGVWTIWRGLTQAWTNASGPAASVTPTGLMYYGRSGTASAATGGLLDEVRITKGIALYTQAAPPTVLPTAPYPNGPQLASGTVAESVTLTDSSNATVTAGIISGSVHESLTLTDSQNTTATYRRQVNEGVTLVDSQNARSTLQASRAESITLSATQDATKQSPQVIPVTVSELITLIAQQDAYIPGKPDRRVGRFGDPVKKGIQEAEKAMIELEDEFILEIVLSLAVKGAIA